MKKKLLFLILMLCSSSIIFGYNNLQINNPKTGYRYGGNIDSVEFMAKPLGAYIEYQLTLCISADNPRYETNDDQLEIVLNFDLPSNSIVTDSWLWIEGIPKQADIMDRWTASAIYEEIVNRRKDPSLLVKISETQFQMNVYPMKPKESRKFKITYLSPSIYNGNDLILNLPTGILKTSSKAISQITTVIVPSEQYGNPESTDSLLNFESYVHSELGTCYKTEINYDSFASSEITMKLMQNMKINVAKYGDINDGYYQLSFLPSALIDHNSKSKKFCFLIDYDKNYSRYDVTSILDQISTNLKSCLNDQDFFNVIFSSISPSPVFDKWMPATVSNIDSIFSSNTISQYSNMTALLGQGLNYINNYENVSLILVSCNPNFNDISNANDLINDITKLNEKDNSICIIDYTTDYFSSNWTYSNRYYNSAYFFTNLARKNSGEYISLFAKNDNFNSNFDEAFNLTIGQTLKSLDVYTSNNDGICYGRMNIQNVLSQAYSLNRTINHFGRYRNGVPTNIDIAFELDGEVYHYKTDIMPTDIAEGDSIISTLWHGLDIIQLEKEENSNQVISEIIDQSIENRILSKYTAFLCLEDEIDLGNFTDDWNDPWNEDIVITVKQDKINNEFKVFPNPFTTSLQIELPNSDQLIEMNIYNTSGQCIKTFSIYDIDSTIIWDGLDDNGIKVSSGTYIIRAIYSDYVVTKKIMKV